MLRRWLPLTLVAAGTAILVASILLWRLSVGAGHSSPLSLPEALAGLPLSSRIDGPEAIAEVERMHAKGFRLRSAAIGRYGSSEQATLWIAQMADRSAAILMTESMSQRIAKAASPFRETGKRLGRDGPIHELVGMGQRDFFYPSGLHVVWLGADLVIAEQALRDTLEVYP